MRKGICDSSEKYLKINVKKSAKFFYKGNKLLELRKYEEAIKAYDKAILYNPKDHAAYHNKSLSLASIGEYELALELIDKAIILNIEKDEEIYQEAMKEADAEYAEEEMQEYLKEGRVLN